MEKLNLVTPDFTFQINACYYKNFEKGKNTMMKDFNVQMQTLEYAFKNQNIIINIL